MCTAGASDPGRRPREGASEGGTEGGVGGGGAALAAPTPLSTPETAACKLKSLLGKEPKGKKGEKAAPF